MLIALFTMLSSLIFGGPADAFYIDKIEKEVYKYVDDKDRKKDLKAEFKAYTKAAKVFDKKLKKHIKELKKKNLDKKTSKQWYVDFFDQLLADRKEQQTLYMDGRIRMQQIITDDEWAEIMKTSAAAATKVDEKEQKKAAKKKDKDPEEIQEEDVKEMFPSVLETKKVLDALNNYQKASHEIEKEYDNINIISNKNLVNKNITKEEMQKLTVKLNNLRAEMYKEYVVLWMTLKEVTNDEEWASIIKKFNKEIK